MARLILDGTLRQLAGGDSIVEIDAQNVKQLLRALSERYPALAPHLEQDSFLLHTPDGRTIRMIAFPHPFGGVLLLYEDVTDRMSLERSYNTLIEVQRETLDNLYEGVAVFGADGRLKLQNPAYGRIWHLPPERLAKEPHVRDLMEATRRFFPIEARDWAEALEQRVAGTTDPAARSGRRESTTSVPIAYITNDGTA